MNKLYVWTDHHTFPDFVFIDSSDILHSSWSAFQDSDDLSDDSSGGEPFFAMGLDLVNALEAK
jgi:hypothetical protein